MNNNKQQTVVHWLQEALEGTILTQDQTMQVIGLFMQADEMFEQQIVEAFVECWKENMPEGYECKQSAEQYYNETFNK
jgi:hypothetical protein